MIFFFFFQAEDGIRDTSVTGVQTCALPNFGDMDALMEVLDPNVVGWTDSAGLFRAPLEPLVGRDRVATQRSEERRVGKECRARWAADRCKKDVCNGIARMSAGKLEGHVAYG